MRIVITGANGQLGRSLQRALAGEEVAALTHADCDVTQDGTVHRIASYDADAVIHAAALTDVERCEREPVNAFVANALGTERVARACQESGATMVYISSECVFDGSENPYNETARPNPINEYGRSKWDGELCVLANLSKFYIVRTAWLYGRGGNNFVEKILGQADRLRVTTQEIGTPTFTDDLAEAIGKLFQVEAPYGIYHLVNTGICSRYEMAKSILSLVRRLDEIEPIESYPRHARVPSAILENRKAARLGITLRHWSVALQEYMQCQTEKSFA